MNDAYAAGLFDGEGYVRVATWKKPSSIHTRYQVIAGIGVTYLPVILQLHEAYGGSLHNNRHDLRNPNNRIQFSWVISSKTAASFFKKVMPYLVIKREQVVLATTLQENIDKYCHILGNQYRLHPDRDRILAERAAIAGEIRRLKKETFPPLSAMAPRVSE